MYDSQVKKKSYYHSSKLGRHIEGRKKMVLADLK